MSEDVSYFNQMLWMNFDKLISSSNLNVDMFVSKDGWGVSPPRIKFSITHYKTKANTQITLCHSDVFQFLLLFKKYESAISSISKEINDDQTKQYSFSIKNKKNLFVTFLHRSEYNGACIRLVISEKNSDYLDSEKFYLSIHDFLSLIVVLGQFRNNYLSVVSSMASIVAMNDLTQKISDMDSKLTNYYSEFMAKSKLIENELQIQQRKLPTEYSPMISLDELTKDQKIDIIEKSEKNQASSSTAKDKSEENEAAIIHDDMSSYIQQNRDTFDLGLDNLTEPIKSKADSTAATVMPTTFTDVMLSNDVTNLEMYMMNLLNDDLPFSKFAEVIKAKLSFDPLEGVPKEDENSADYIISMFLKTIVRDNLEKKQEIPLSVPPLVFDNVNSNENKISMAYDLYLYCIYYSHLRNVLKDKDYGVVANKEMVTFALKVISSPYVFSLVKSIDEKVLVSELVNRFRRYKDLGVFQKLEKDIQESRSVVITITEDTIKNEASRIYNVIIQRWNSLTIEGTFKDRNSILKYEDFKKNKLSKEQIKKILAAEFSFKKNKRVDFKEAGINGFDDIPLTISEKYGIVKQKFDNTNLKRFIKEKCKDNEDLYKKCTDVADLVNESYKDLKNKNVDYSVIPEEILKAIILWDLKSDNKCATNYVYFLEQIQKSNLSRDMIISMLMDVSEVKDDSFTNSFIAARDD